MECDSTIVSNLSEASAASLPGVSLGNSLKAGWSSVLLEHHQGDGRCDPFDTLPTPDQTIVIATRGDHELAVFRNASWRRALYRPGVGGMTPGAESSRLRWSGCGPSPRFQTAHLYIPQHYFQAVAEHCRRAGQRCRYEPLSALAFNDNTVSRVVGSLLQAMLSRVPDLYADATANWLAAHLLSFGTSSTPAAQDSWRPEVLTDRRLARVIEFMSANIAEPLTIARLAAEAAVSRFHFVRLFRRKVGTTPHAYLMRLRIDAAKTMLSTTDRPIAHVAHDCGYARPANFATAFAKQVGMRPTEFRKAVMTGSATLGAWADF